MTIVPKETKLFLLKGLKYRNVFIEIEEQNGKLNCSFRFYITSKQSTRHINKKNRKQNRNLCTNNESKESCYFVVQKKTKNQSIFCLIKFENKNIDR